MNIACIASEVDPLAKTGGLADVAAALPKALANLGHDVRIIMPLYRQVNRAAMGLKKTPLTVSVTVGPRAYQGRVWETRLPKSAVPVYCLEQPDLFDRDGLYQVQGQDHADNLTRFSFFAQAALRLLPALSWRPEVVHAHDWQAALACAQLAFGPLGRDPFFADTATAFTVHNLAYQGVFPADQWPLTGLPDQAFGIEGLEFYGQVNCLKGGLVSAGALTTVSPTYANEIQTAEFGCGLDGVLRARRASLVGIVNGIDPEAWNPQTDPHLAAAYSLRQPGGKARCKAALQKRQGFADQPDTLAIGMIQRLAEQKGIDIFSQALERLMTLPLQIVMLGTGDPKYHQALEALQARFRDRLAVNLTFDNALAHQIEAGADAFLMPSRFEPCGLNQLYSMRYGTVPIVRKVGGLADTVVDATPAALANGTATGLVFEEYSARALIGAVERAVAAFHDATTWKALMRHGMQQDTSWANSARAYLQVYQRALAHTPNAALGSRL